MRAAQRQRYQGASTFDFRQTEKFTSDQNRFLEKIFVGFSEAVVTQLAPLLQSRFQMELIKLKTFPYHSYLNSLPEPTPVLVFRLNDNTSGFIDIDFDLSFAIFERLMGGKGALPREELRPYFTDLEKAILKKPLGRILGAFGEAWKDVGQVEAQFQSLEFNPNAVYICAPSETMVVTAFQVDVAHAQGLLNVCVPFRYLKEMIPKRSFDEFMLTTTFQAPKDDKIVYAEHIHNAKVPISVSLGRAELLFQELLTIEVGDTIRLDSEIRDPLRIKVNNKTKFLGQPGIKDGRLAAKINRVLQEGDEEYDE
ncbi:MAG: flagellar motor switch protein FliM [Candidatus Eremiobacteraeota bacterium]|nr:flagellar motor switch protein FliM [Candidatus Eremiobacteraeota bacterium]